MYIHRLGRRSTAARWTASEERLIATAASVSTVGCDPDEMCAGRVLLSMLRPRISVTRAPKSFGFTLLRPLLTNEGIDNGPRNPLKSFHANTLNCALELSKKCLALLRFNFRMSRRNLYPIQVREYAEK